MGKDNEEFNPDIPIEEQEAKPNGSKPDAGFDDMARREVADTARAADAAQLRLTDLVFNPDAEHLLEMTDIPTSQTERIIMAELLKELPDILASNGNMDIMEELLKIRNKVYRARSRKLIIDAHKFMSAEKENSKEIEDKLWG